MRRFHDWYERVHPDLTQHGIWLRGGEINTLSPQEFERRDLRVLFVRLSTYDDTGYSFTHQILYQIAAGTEGVHPDLAYLPPARDAALFEAGGVPWLLGTQTKLGPEAFDVVGFSNSIVQELVNVPAMLERSGVPLSKRERLARPDVPLLLLGGANALYTSALWNDDALVDAIFVGESDAAIRRILEIARDGKRRGLDKAAVLAELETVPGVFQPERPRSTTKSFIPNLNQSEALERGPVYYVPDQLGSSHLQISEGCPCFCSFCAESWDRKPYRERRHDVLREVALAAKASMGLDSIDIYSFNFNMHSGFYRVLWDLVPHFRGIGLKSQRFDLLAHDPEMVEFQHAIEKASLTCGLEGVSPRMRSYLHKNLEDEDLHASLTAIFKSGARQMKVFLIATGLEEEQDLVALDDLLDHMRGIRDRAHASTRVVFSITPLVRFPWTPLEFEDAPTMERLEPILAAVGRRVRGAGFEFRESADLPEYWVSQVLIRADDPRIGRALLGAVRATGFVYYREVPERFRAALESALVAEGLEPAKILAGYGPEEGLAKPWAAISTGVHRDFLWAEVLRARQYSEIDYCLGRSWTRAKCFHCGGCPTKEHIRDIVLARQDRPYRLDEFRDRVRAARTSETQVGLLVDVGERGRGVPRKMVAVAVARALMLEVPELRLHYRGYDGSHWDVPDREPIWTTGLDVLQLRFAREGLEALGVALADDSTRARLDAAAAGWAAVLGVAPEEWAPETLLAESPHPWAGDPWLDGLHLKYTRHRAGEGAYRYEIQKASLKKGVLRDLTVRTGGGLTRVEVALGPKFDPAGFARRAFRLPGKNEWVRVRLHADGPRSVEGLEEPVALPLRRR